MNELDALQQWPAHNVAAGGGASGGGPAFFLKKTLQIHIIVLKLAVNC